MSRPLTDSQRYRVVLALLDTIASSPCEMASADILCLCKAREILSGCVDGATYDDSTNRYRVSPVVRPPLRCQELNP